MPEDILEGINLHKKIDQFTDTHPVWKASKGKFYKRHGKYAAVLTDMVYDVYLIRNWKRYTGEPLDQFTAEIYPLLLKHKEVMPSKLKGMIDKMVADNFLMRYTTQEGLQASLTYMDKRTKFPSRFSEAILDIEENDEALNKEFNSFFPELIAFVDAECDC